MLKKIVIKELYGYITKSVTFSDENFLVGINGSGKTSILRLIEAFFKMDIDFFLKTEFKKIIIETSEDTYHIKKEKKEIYIYSEKKSLSIQEEKLNELEKKYKNYKEYIEEKYRIFESNNISKIQNLEKDLYKTIYLENIKEFLKKINKIQNLKGYFSLKELSKYYTKMPKVLNIGLEKNILEKDSLFIIKLFNQGNLPNLEAEFFKTLSPIKKVNQIFKQIEYQYMKLNNKKLFDLLNKSEEDINNSSTKVFNLKTKIDAFVNLINTFYVDTCKKLVFNQYNAKFMIEVYNTNRQNILNLTNFEALSSGEKQLLVILTILFFKIENNTIFLFDELEKSLHIEWQLKLIKVVRELIKEYKNTQLILATHSPQIIKDVEYKNFIPLDPHDIVEGV